MDNNVKKRKFNYNYLSVGLIYLLSLSFLLSIPSIKEAESRLTPTVICIFAILLSTILLVKTYLKHGKNEEVQDFSGSKMAFVLAFSLLVYIVSIVYLGFYISTPIFLFVTMLILGQKNKKLMLIISGSMVVVVYFFFDVLLKMQIPEGILISAILDRF